MTKEYLDETSVNVIPETRSVYSYVNRLFQWCQIQKFRSPFLLRNIMELILSNLKITTYATYLKMSFEKK